MSYYRVENCLPPKRLIALKEYVSTVSNKFKCATVTPPMHDFRLAKILDKPDLPQAIDLIIDKHLELAAIALCVRTDGFRECQITCTPNGGYFRRHIDNSGNLDRRGLAYVLYFGNPVIGGELFLDLPGGGVTIAPCDNSIVVFPAHLPHEVLPVVCGEAFLEGRFTVNGWIGKI